MNLLEKWSNKKLELDYLKAELLTIEVDIYKKFKNDLDFEEGTFKHEKDGLKLTVTKKITTKVDQTLAQAHKDLFKVEYKLDKKLFKSLDKEKMDQVEDCLITKPAKPSFKVEVIDE